MDFTIKLSWPLSSLHVNVCRCSQLDLRGCALREVSISIQRDGEPQDTPFSCRVGEIMVRQWEPLVSNVFSILYMVRDPDKSLFTFEQQKKLLRYYYYFLTATTTSAVSVFQTSADISPFNAFTLTDTSNPFRPQVFTLEQQKNFSPIHNLLYNLQLLPVLTLQLTLQQTPSVYSLFVFFRTFTLIYIFSSLHRLHLNWPVISVQGLNLLNRIFNSFQHIHIK